MNLMKANGEKQMKERCDWLRVFSVCLLLKPSQRGQKTKFSLIEPCTLYARLCLSQLDLIFWVRVILSLNYKCTVTECKHEVSERWEKRMKKSKFNSRQQDQI